MIVVRENPTQFERPINYVCSYLNNALQTKLGLEDAQILGYGKIYRVKIKNGFRPCFYQSVTKNEYKEVLFDDKLALMYFFGVGDTIEYKGAFGVIDVHLVVSANLKLVYPNDSTRNDVELRETFMKLLYIAKKGFSFQSEQFGFNQSLSEYDGLKDTDMAKFDMHPNHIFRINFKLTFPINYKIQ